MAAAGPSPGGHQQRTVTHVLAIEDWHSSLATDLSFRQGDVIAVSGKSGAWWHGTLDGRSGDLPETYVLQFLPGKPQHVQALREFIGTRFDEAVPELCFVPGDRLTLKAHGPGEWAYGTLCVADPARPQTGIFPVEYVTADDRGRISPACCETREKRCCCPRCAGKSWDWRELQPAEPAERWAAAVRWAVEEALDGPEDAGLATLVHDAAGRPRAPSYFDMLGVEDSAVDLSGDRANHELLRENFRRTSRLLHPDKQSVRPADLATKDFQLLKNAYDTLSSAPALKSYREQLADAVRRSSRNLPHAAAAAARKTKLVAFAKKQEWEHCDRRLSRWVADAQIATNAARHRISAGSADALVRVDAMTDVPVDEMTSGHMQHWLEKGKNEMEQDGQDCSKEGVDHRHDIVQDRQENIEGDGDHEEEGKEEIERDEAGHSSKDSATASHVCDADTNCCGHETDCLEPSQLVTLQDDSGSNSAGLLQAAERKLVELESRHAYTIQQLQEQHEIVCRQHEALADAKIRSLETKLQENASVHLSRNAQEPTFQPLNLKTAAKKQLPRPLDTDLPSVASLCAKLARDVTALRQEHATLRQQVKLDFRRLTEVAVAATMAANAAVAAASSGDSVRDAERTNRACSPTRTVSQPHSPPRKSPQAVAAFSPATAALRARLARSAAIFVPASRDGRSPPRSPRESSTGQFS